MQFIELFTHASAENFLNSHQLTAALAGTLTVNLLGGFIPDIGQTFAILTADDFDGTFVSEVLPSVPGLMFDVIYNPNSVVLTVSPAFTADFDEDDDVDSDDLTQRHGGFGENALSDADTTATPTAMTSSPGSGNWEAFRPSPQRQSCLNRQHSCSS